MDDAWIDRHAHERTSDGRLMPKAARVLGEDFYAIAVRDFLDRADAAAVRALAAREANRRRVHARLGDPKVSRQPPVGVTRVEAWGTRWAQLTFAILPFAPITFAWIDLQPTHECRSAGRRIGDVLVHMSGINQSKRPRTRARAMENLIDGAKDERERRVVSQSGPLTRWTPNTLDELMADAVRCAGEWADELAKRQQRRMQHEEDWREVREQAATQRAVYDV